MDQTASIPKLSLSTLDLKNNYFVVRIGRFFHYFPVKILEETLDKNLMRFEKSPPVLIDGVVIIKKKIYEVPVQDLLRGLIRKSREITQERDSHGSATHSQPTTIGSSDATTSTSTTRETSVLDQDKPGADRALGLEIDEDADNAWEEQIQSLLGFVSSKEGGEWEVESIAQPGRRHESNTVPDPDQDSIQG